MMAVVDSLRTITVYFMSEYAAMEVAGNLRPVVEVEGPLHVKPYMGRAFALKITLPEGMSPMVQYPDSHLMSRINRLVMQYDGVASKAPGETSW